MKHLAWLVALPTALVEMRYRWVSFPLSRQLAGDALSFLAYAPGAAHAQWLSYGVAAALLTLLAAFAFIWGKSRFLGLLGAGLILLAAGGILKVAFADGALLAALNSEFNEQQSATAFAKAALPPNAGAQPAAWSRLPLDTLPERFAGSFYFTRLACWMTLLAGLLALAISLRRSRLAAWATAAGLPLLVIGMVAGPARGERLVERGASAESRGDPATAVRRYREALACDSWLANQLDLYQRIGAIDAALGRTSTIEYGIYHAELPSTQVDPAKSVAELSALIPRAAPPLAGLLRRSAAELLTQNARALHGAGAHGAAATACELALSYDPASILPAYYLSRQYYLVGAYQRAIELTKATVARTADPSIRADLYSNIGDAQTKLGLFAEARIAYRTSYQYDYLLNLRALSALDGP